jgi:hypothetical protein
MSKISRVTQLIFGSNAGANQIAQFGSYTAGSPEFTTNPATIQALAEYVDGWFSAVLQGNSPAIEDMNALCYLYAYQLAYLMQAGVAEWDSATVYYLNSMVNYGGVIYYSLIDSNTNNIPSSTPSDWKVLASNPMTSAGDLVYGTTNGVPVRLPIGSNSQILQVTAGLPSWVSSQFSAQSPNMVYAGPGSGSAAIPGFRQLVYADIPATQVVVGTAQTALGTTSSTTYATPTNAPTVSITALYTATYVISGTIAYDNSTSGKQSWMQINATTGAPTILIAQEVTMQGTSTVSDSPYTLANLISGSSYVFTLQAKTTSGGTAEIRSDDLSISGNSIMAKLA